MTSAVKCLLLALLVAAVSSQGSSSGKLDNQCLRMLRSSSEAEFNSVVAKCLNAARGQQGKLPSRLLVKLTARCVGRGLNYLQADGKTINKPAILAAVQSNRVISEEERRTFYQRIISCQNFDECVARDCQL